MKRPFWCVGLTCLVCCLFGMWLPTVWVAALAVIGLTAWIAVSFFRCRTLWLILLAGWVSFCSLWISEAMHYQPLRKRVDDTVSLSARVYDTENGVYLQVLSGDLPTGTRLRLWYGGDRLEPRRNDVLQGQFTLRMFEETPWERAQTKASSVWFAVSLEEKTLTVTAGTPPLSDIFVSLRNEASRTIETVLGGDAGAVVSGICFGADNDLSSYAHSTFRQSGITHLLSVSGFHMAVVSALLLKMLEPLGMPRTLRSVSTVAVVLFFMSLVGLEPSVVRSGILCMFTVLGRCFRRQADTRNSLGIALTVLLLINPFSAYDVGLLLSFFATFGLVEGYPRLIALFNHRWFSSRLLRPLIESVCMTVSVTIATFPILILYFGEVSLISLLGNLLVFSAATVLLLLGYLAVFCALLVPFLANGVFLLAGLTAKYLLWVADRLSSLPFTALSFNEPWSVCFLLALPALCALGYRLCGRDGVRFSLAVGAAVAALSVCINTLHWQDHLRITALYTEDGTALLVETDTQTTLLCTVTETATAYTLRRSLYTDLLETVDTIVLLDGKESAVTVLLSVLEPYEKTPVFVCDENDRWLADHVQTMPLTEDSFILNETLKLSYDNNIWHLQSVTQSLTVKPSAITRRVFRIR